MFRDVSSGTETATVATFTAKTAFLPQSIEKLYRLALEPQWHRADFPEATAKGTAA
jgi:hypothetical protein